jgi:hypothetical protein
MERTMTNNLTSLVMENLRAVTAREYPLYANILDHSFCGAPPPYSMNWFGRRYFELARNPEWFANSLVANSALEGYGSTQVWNFSARMHQDEYVAAVQKHALDESRHSTMFVSMLHLTFPGLEMDARTEERIERQQPRYSPSNPPESTRLVPEARMSAADSISELVGIHLTEIRALVLQYLLRSVIEVYAPAESQRRIGMFCASLIRDESRHIDYTARIFESLAAEGHTDQLVDIFEARVRDFNDVTMTELEREKQMAI